MRWPRTWVRCAGPIWPRSAGPQRSAGGLDAAARRRMRRERLNDRKRALTAQSSARWASAIIGANDGQYRLSRDGQDRHIIGLRVAISTIEKRLAAPCGDTLTAQQRSALRKARLPKGYPTQVERFNKQRRLQHLRADLARRRSRPRRGAGAGQRGHQTPRQNAPPSRCCGSQSGAVAPGVGVRALPDPGQRCRG